MNPISHAIVSWVSANASPGSSRKDRIIVTCAGLSPDIDGLGAIVEFFTRNNEKPILWWSDYHHVLCHNLGFCLLVTLAAFLLSGRNIRTALLSMFIFHIHLFCDIAGARGPEGYQWPIPYLLPFSDKLNIAWKHQWAYASWQNMAITILFIIAAIVISVRLKRSPCEILSKRADKEFVAIMHKWFC